MAAKAKTKTAKPAKSKTVPPAEIVGHLEFSMPDGMRAYMPLDADGMKEYELRRAEQLEELKLKSEREKFESDFPLKALESRLLLAKFFSGDHLDREWSRAKLMILRAVNNGQLSAKDAQECFLIHNELAASDRLIELEVWLKARQEDDGKALDTDKSKNTLRTLQKKLSRPRMPQKIDARDLYAELLKERPKGKTDAEIARAFLKNCNKTEIDNHLKSVQRYERRLAEFNGNQ